MKTCRYAPVSSLHALLVFAGVSASVLSANTAFGVTFTPVRPPTCPTTTNIPWNYRIGGLTGVWDLPQDPNCVAGPYSPCPHYINYLDNRRYFVANPWVGYVGFRVGYMQTEAAFDFVKWGVTGTTLSSASGPVSAGTVFWASTGGSFDAETASLNFSADYSETRQGVSLDQIQVCTSRTSPDTRSPPTMAIKHRYHGVLLGTNDVVYLKFTIPPSSLHYPITLWEDGSPEHDFDLYARCGAMPTPSQFDYRSFDIGSQEYLDVEHTRCTGTMYVAVSSFSGSGAFSVVVGTHLAGALADNGDVRLLAGTNFNATSAELATISATLREAARRFYGSTEGERAITQIDLYNNGCSVGGGCGGPSCAICFVNGDGRAHALCKGYITIFKNEWAVPKILHHELGHHLWCLKDEYDDDTEGDPFQCGHSLMGNAWGPKNNNFCVDFDHKQDKHPNAPPTSYPSAMKQARDKGLLMTAINETLDNFSYVDFDFNDRVGKVVIH